MIKWKKLPPTKEKDLYIGCLNCSTAAIQAPLDMIICVGFGSAYVTRDNKTVYDGEQDFRDEVSKLNELVKDPKSDCSSQDVCASVKKITKLFFGNISFIEVNK